MTLRVEREDTRRPDHHVVDVHTLIAHLHRVQHVPTVGQFGEFLADLHLALDADPPGTFIRLDTEHPRHEVENRRLRIDLLALRPRCGAGDVE